jgi:hypothetical protein
LLDFNIDEIEGEFSFSSFPILSDVKNQIGNGYNWNETIHELYNVFYVENKKRANFNKGLEKTILKLSLSFTACID